MHFGTLDPIGTLRSRAEYLEFVNSESALVAKRFDAEVTAAHADRESWLYPGYCEPCDQNVLFQVDRQCAWQADGQWVINFRERLSCPITGLNNRMRLVATLLRQRFRDSKRIYLQEQVTAFYRWCRENLSADLVGSEYLGPEYPAGIVIEGILHQDVEALTFPDKSFDVIVSNDVFEHVPSPRKGLSECARVLRHEGVMLTTIPFFLHEQESRSRATIKDGEVLHILPAEYHGNPVSPAGSLVFTDYGWGLLDLAKQSGFSEAWAEVYHEPAFGHIGPGLFVFFFVK